MFRGASIVTETRNLDEILALPYVSRVWLNERIQLDPTIQGGPANEASALQYTTHNNTGVSKLHDLGIFGKGVTIGVVDTGIAYR